MKSLKILAAFSFCLLLAACGSGTTKPSAPGNGSGVASGAVAVTPTGSGTITKWPDPAATNCLKEGGKVTVKVTPAGNQYAICTFDENRQCETWALMLGDCQKGGVKVTGYDEVETYCAITGGTVVDAPGKPVLCQLPEHAGTCDSSDYFAKENGCLKQ